MKTTNQSQEKSTLVQKTTKLLMYFGILSALFITTSFGRNAVDQQNNDELKGNSVSVEANLHSSSLSKPEIVIESESELTETIAVIATDYVKPMIETLKENEQIIESKEEFDFESYFGRSIDEIMLENEMIIESDRIDEAFPLDMKLINNYSGENREGFQIKSGEALKS
jgi:phosphohistidine swiveling domain-containing protein